MIRYITRRVLQMIPTFFGVILVTFVLFNVVGGSPALIKLGENATPKSLEEFDEQRGFNKPLIFGWRVPTRAFQPGLLSADTNVEHLASGGWKFVAGQDYEMPLAFPLRADARYEWSLTCVREDGSRFGARLPSETNVIQSLMGSNPFIVIRDIELVRLVDNPFDSQLFFFLKQLARFDLGYSSSANLPVSQILRDGIGPTLCLAVPILVLETVLSVALSLGCAFYRARWPDRAMVFASTVLMSVNYLVWIVVGQYVLAYKFSWFPVWGFASWSYLALPVLIGVVSGLGSEVRFYRSIMLDEMYKDYVRTAYAKGVGTGGVLFRHVLKNALIPVITNVSLSIPFLYTGSLLLESYFGIPGLGYLSVNAINDADVDVVRAVVVVGSVLYLFVNLLADICYSIVDPRVRLS
ncbi:MAG: ABC transporter permease [bacterium]